MDIIELKTKLCRQSVVMQIGGARPPSDLSASWFGKVNLALPGEEWPEWDGIPLSALCQINVKALPMIPPLLADLEFITLFIDTTDLPDEAPNGEGWCLRAYKDITKLMSIEETETDSEIKPFPMFPHVHDDFPCHEDCEIDLPNEIEENYYDHFAGLDGFKIGGWPRLLQCELDWSSKSNPADFGFAFQIDTCEKANFGWSGGTAYFGRGRAPGYEQEWTMCWQGL